MISGISGRPGGGKSYEAVVTHIIPVVTQDKRKVVTNLPLNVDHFCSVYGEYCRDLIEVVDGEFHNYGGERPFSKVDHYLQYEDWQNEKGQKVYFFIDECHMALPMGTKITELEEFYSMHRHYGFDIMLITQFFRKVNRNIRDLVGNHYRCVKKSFSGQDDKYILKIHDGSSSSNQSVMNTEERTYDKKFFAFYNSHTKSESSVQEASSKDVKQWHQHWTTRGAVLMFVLFVFLLFKGCSENSEVSEVHYEVPVKQESPSGSPSAAVQQTSKTIVKKKTRRQIEFDEMVERSKDYHPFYKVALSITGMYEGLDGKHQVRRVFFNATQNGVSMFDLSSSDLALAGYDVQVLADCAVRIKYYDYEDYITCNKPIQQFSAPLSDEVSLLD